MTSVSSRLNQNVEIMFAKQTPSCHVKSYLLPLSCLSRSFSPLSLSPVLCLSPLNLSAEGAIYICCPLLLTGSKRSLSLFGAIFNLLFLHHTLASYISPLCILLYRKHNNIQTGSEITLYIKLTTAILRLRFMFKFLMLFTDLKHGYKRSDISCK